VRKPCRKCTMARNLAYSLQSHYTSHAPDLRPRRGCNASSWSPSVPSNLSVRSMNLSSIRKLSDRSLQDIKTPFSHPDVISSWGIDTRSFGSHCPSQLWSDRLEHICVCLSSTKQVPRRLISAPSVTRHTGHHWGKHRGIIAVADTSISL